MVHVDAFQVFVTVVDGLVEGIGPVYFVGTSLQECLHIDDYQGSGRKSLQRQIIGTSVWTCTVQHLRLVPVVCKEQC